MDFKKLKAKIVIAFVCCLTHLTLTANESNESTEPFVTSKKIETLESFVNQTITEFDIPGVAVGIIQPGKPMYFRGFGKANEKAEDISRDTAFNMGSVTKPITALAIMQLFEEGKIDIDSPIVKYIPWFQTKTKADSDKILIKHLLNQTSGFSTYLGNRNMDSENKSPDAVKQSISRLTQFELISAPGESYEYSNVNFQLLGYLLEVIEGDSYENVIDKKIFRPLNMNNSFAQTQAKPVASLSQGYSFIFGNPTPVNREIGRTDIGDGNIYSSIQDMSLLLKDLLSDDSQLISSETKKMMTTLEGENATYGYGFGWFVNHHNGHTVIFHPGSYFGYEAVAAYSPDLNIAFVILVNTNSSFGYVNIRHFIRGIGNIILGNPVISAHAPISEKIIIGAIFGLSLLIILYAAFYISRRSQGKIKPLMRPVAFSELARRFIFPSVCLFGISCFFMIVIPRINGITIQTFANSEPTAFLATATISLVSFVWFVILSILLFKRR